MSPCVYILASRRNGSLYIGVTGDLRRRLGEHRAGQVEHTRRYRIRRLVLIEPHRHITEAILREKRLKAWKRSWKIRLIEATNPDWDDLTHRLVWME